MKLWQKGESIDKLFEEFTIGNDPVLDLQLAPYDIQGSIAHAKMLGKVGLLTANETSELCVGLENILLMIERGEFVIEDGIEDCHSQIELLLIRSLGDLGKKVHAGRSRNDQVLTALKLFTKDHLKVIASSLKRLFDLLIAKSEANKNRLMPGYTHMQIAMPSSFGLWFGAYAESLVDDLIGLKAAYDVVNKNPLGSAAGYGSSFPLDREFTTDELDFGSLNFNSIYAQMTRGKMEKMTAGALATLASTISKFCSDVCLYNGQNYQFFELDKRFTTGSSIMPHKNNPDGFELVRAKCNQLQSLPNELVLILSNLPSGYHRDLQVTKDHFIPAITTFESCLEILISMVEGLEVNEHILNDSKYDLLFSVEKVNQYVLEGMTFRDAYRKVAQDIKAGDYVTDKELNHTHIGSIGNLANDKISDAFCEVYERF